MKYGLNLGYLMKKIPFETILDTPIVAGGLIETKEEIAEACNSGAIAVSTGRESLWN